jgi:hypothetical protein
MFVQEALVLLLAFGLVMVYAFPTTMWRTFATTPVCAPSSIEIRVLVHHYALTANTQIDKNIQMASALKRTRRPTDQMS